MDAFRSLVQHSRAALGDTLTFVIFTSLADEAGFQPIFHFFKACVKNGWLKAYQIQAKSADTALESTTAKGMLKAHLVEAPAVLAGVWLLWFRRWMSLDNPTPTSFKSFAMQLVGTFLVSETFQYWWHRLEHENSWVYRHVHKKHHEYSKVTPYAANHNAALEVAFTITLPSLVWVHLFRHSFFTFLVWRAWGTFQNVLVHTGYQFPFLPKGTERHDWHHSHNKGNYANWLTIWDVITGTDATYVNWKVRQAEKEDGARQADGVASKAA
ncbi:hypothetical protein M427DRAFT_147612 [Gonapodya prolifera JEL478]|uniref:Fatty acid hydroxylase domain-containing protein n=1 Tax=Gonapodya prolifera (strain JEL478) TaxID=1344416 RepID=A0A139A4N9_GONPJ|nr:hypothetical protein M427DRAFT_147612 [Gonapodya prolifera JEL478]|eukprot:KXS11766.1 hypothetical protein M427DRAFT_147612 [Gonapodya prolifera JEL478]